MDSFTPGRTRIKYRKLIALLPQQCEMKVPACHRLITLTGTRKPTQLCIELDPYDPEIARPRGIYEDYLEQLVLHVYFG